MAKISVYNFAGETPRVDPKLLNDRFATTASNVELRRGQIAPSKTVQSYGLSVSANTKTLYLFNKAGNGGNGFWFLFDGDVDVVRGLIAGDTFERTYYTGDGSPKITDITLATGAGGPYPENAHDLGLPAPANSTVAVGPTGEVPEEVQELNTAYIVTFVSARGEEGPPSEATNIVSRWDGATVELTGIPVASGNFTIQTKRIYRAELTGVYQFVAEIPAAQTTFSDNINSEYLGEACPSDDWIAPHPDLHGLIALTNGMMVGGWGNTVAVCEAFQPHAWPTEYQQAMDYDFVAAAATSAGAVIGTTGKPYLFAGSDPASMSLIPMDEVHACASKRSMVDMGEYVIYASPDGLVAVGGTDARLITEPLMLPSQFRERFKPESIHAYRYEDRYLAFYDNGTEQGAFSFNMEEGFRFYSQGADAAFLDDESGKLFIAYAGDMYEWDAGPVATYVWRSKIWPVPVGTRFTAGKVEADSYPLTLDFFADGVLLKSVAVASSKAFRLPYFSRYRQIQFEVRGDVAISNIQIASSMSEIQ